MHVSDARRYYYLHNFHRALDWLHARSGDVLRDDDRAFIDQFVRLPERSRALLVRLVMRKGPWFRASKLVYDEIGCIPTASAPLLARGWLCDQTDMTAPEFFGLLRLPELREVFDSHPDRPRRAYGLRKNDLLVQLPETLTSLVQPWRKWWPEATDSVLHLSIAPLCERLRLMFFGNLHQHWSTFVLADLGIFKFEPVTFSAVSRAFSHANEVDIYIQLHVARRDLDEGAGDADILSRIDALDCYTPWLSQRRDRIRFLVGQRAERTHDWDAALRAYDRCGWPGARHRRARVLERAGRYELARQVAQDAILAPESDEERQRLSRLMSRLQPVAKGRRRTRMVALPVPTTDIVLDPGWHRVELALLEHLDTPGRPVFYVENALVNSLFGLLCWDAVFADVPGAFFHPFQVGPADLEQPTFARLREPWLAHAWQALADGSWCDIVRARYVQKQGVMSPFVHWGRLSPELLDAALTCIAGEHLKIWFDRLLSDVRANRTGWPDLIRFDLARRSYDLIEVKGPGDRLQDNQKRWLDHCVAHGMAVGVMHVTWRTP